VLDLPKLRDLATARIPSKAACAADPRGIPVRSGPAGRLSFTNLLDLDSAARIVLEFNEPASAVIDRTGTGRHRRSAFDACARARANSPAAFEESSD
jgi:hypothetical protein